MASKAAMASPATASALPPSKPAAVATAAAAAAASAPAGAGSGALPPTSGPSSSSLPGGNSSAAPNQQLQLAPNCQLCQASGDLYGSPCLHMTLCRPCGKSMAENSRPCTECGKPVLRLVMEYTVRTSANPKNYFVGNFRQGLPGLSRKNDMKWSMWREGAQGRQLTDLARERYKSKPWILEDSTKKHQYQGVPESQQSTYFIFIRRDKDFIALPMASWYNFRPMQTYRMLTLEEAEQQMANRRKAFQKIMMKPVDASGGGDGDALGGSGAGGRRFKGGSDDDGSPHGDGDSDDDEARRKEKFGTKRGNKDEKAEDGEDAADDPEIDLDDDEPEKGDDWEHEETFTDDDDAPGNEPEEKEEERPPTPPPEIKEESEEEEQEGEGLSKSGKELKKLLGKSVFNEDGVEEPAVPTQEEEDDDEDVDLDKEDEFSPVFCIRKKDVKEEAGDGKSATTEKTNGSGTGSAAPGGGGGGRGGGKNNKRKGPEKGGDGAASTGPGKKAKVEPGTNREGGKGRGSKTAGTAAGASGDVASGKAASSAPKADPGTAAVPGRVPTGHGADAAAAGKAPAGTATKPSAKPATPGGTTAGESASGAITEEEVRRVLSESGPIKSAALITKFKKQIKDPEERAKFAAILKRISKIQETPEGKFITLRTNAAARKS